MSLKVEIHKRFHTICIALASAVDEGVVIFWEFSTGVAAAGDIYMQREK